MQHFKDSASGQVWSFEDDVTATAVKGVYDFKDAEGRPLSVPATLQPYTPAAPTTAELLAAAQAAQIAVLTRQAHKVIVGGFSSAALGAPHTYPSTPTDQANLASAAIAALNAPAGWETPLSCADASGAWSLVQHTATQVAQVKTDELVMISAARVKLAALKMSVVAETTIPAVQAITW
jgi:hypothetical protein